MRDPSTFSIDEIVLQLQKLEIPYASEGGQTSRRYGFKSLRQVDPGGIYYLSSDIAERPEIEHSIILHAGIDCAPGSNVLLQVDDPQLVFYQLMDALAGRKRPPAGIHPTAIVGDDCDIDSSATIGPFCVLEGCVVGPNVVLRTHVVVMEGTIIEESVTVEAHSTIGATGVAWVWNPATRERVIQPQIGYTLIGRGSFLGSDITVVRGSVNETTSIGDGCVIAHGSKIGHGSRIGAECHFANNISIAGNVTLGRQCFLGSGAVVRPNVRLADRTIVGAGAVVVDHSEESGVLLMGVPARPARARAGSMAGVPRPLND